MKYFVYIIYSAITDRFYIGQTSDVEGRIVQHNTGHYKTASTKLAKDWEHFWQLECESKKQAIRIESHIKKMRNRDYYNNLKKHPGIGEKLLNRYNC